jgi:hypothetical protein
LSCGAVDTQLGPGSASKWERSIEPSLEEIAQAKLRHNDGQFELRAL